MTPRGLGLRNRKESEGAEKLRVLGNEWDNVTRGNRLENFRFVTAGARQGLRFGFLPWTVTVYLARAVHVAKKN